MVVSQTLRWYPKSFKQLKVFKYPGIGLIQRKSYKDIKKNRCIGQLKYDRSSDTQIILRLGTRLIWSVTFEAFLVAFLKDDQQGAADTN